MLSGILLIGREESFKLFFKKRLSRLMIPFIFWVLVYIVYSSKYTLLNVTNIIFGASGTLGVTFWFVWMIILMYIGIYIINSAIQIIGKNNADRLMMVLGIVSLAYFIIINFGYFNPYPSNLVYFASFITYIIFGYIIANNSIVGEYVNVKVMICLTSIASLLLYFYYIGGFVVPRSLAAGTFVNLGYFNTLILVLSVNVFVLFKYLSKTSLMDKIENSKTGETIMLISKYSFGIYLIHYLIIHVMKTYVLNLITLPIPFISLILLVILTLIISISVLWILNRIPVLKYFTGFN